MSGTLAIEAQLNGIIKEYLEFYGFGSTVEKFNEECSKKGKSIFNVDKTYMNNSEKIMNEMMSSFIRGERKEFFAKWLENIPPDKIEKDSIGQKLELELYIYFAIYPLRRLDKDMKVNSKEDMNALKQYMENKTRILCETKENLSLFGLPHHPNPQEGYPKFFTDEWQSGLKNRLEDFLARTLRVQSSMKECKLFEIFTNKMDGSQSVTLLKKQLMESEKRTMAFMRKFNRVQSDYHALIGITAELVDSLESTISGKPVTPEYIQKICFKLFNTQLKQTIDFSRPGTAGEYIRKSLAYQKHNSEKPGFKSLSQLDYAKIKQDLKSPANEKRQICLLQALRWRLTKAESTEERQKILAEYIQGDLLDFDNDNKPSSVIDLFESSNPTIREYMARLINTFASLNLGRSYLSRTLNGGLLIRKMLDLSRKEKGITPTKKNLLAAMQKMSLRHKLQNEMINAGVTEYILKLLENNQYLDDYSLEYAAVFLMNLSFKHAVLNKFRKDYKPVMTVLSDLLGNKEFEVRKYTHGCLLLILQVPEIRNYANSIDLKDTLKARLSDENDQDENARIKMVIEKLDSENDEFQKEENEEEDDEEDGENMEKELDQDEIVIKSGDELIGENLLATKYSLSSQAEYEPKVANFNNNSARKDSDNRIRESFSAAPRLTTPMNNMKSQVVYQNHTPPKVTEYQRSTSRKENEPNNRKSIAVNSTRNAKNSIKDDPELAKQSKETNILVIQSNDQEFLNSLEMDPKVVNSNSKYSLAKDSIEIFNTSSNYKPSTTKPAQQQQQQRKTSSHQISANVASSTFLPKYSSAEPRASSSSASLNNSSSPTNDLSTTSQMLKK